jgi:hypothetical protein
VVERSRENLLLAEDYIAREKLGEEDDDPTAPPAAGGRRALKAAARLSLQSNLAPARQPDPCRRY